MLRLGYNTNGFLHHRLEDACAILADIGYRSVAVTVESDLLDPPDLRGVDRAAQRLTAIIQRHDLSVTIETGARFILDPRRKHQPTLISSDPRARSVRAEFLKACVALASRIGAESVSLWSGAADAPGTPSKDVPQILMDGLHELLEHARQQGDIRLSFEPEPGMAIATMEQFERLHHQLHHPLFGLTLDVGHVHCLGDGNVAGHMGRWQQALWNIHMEDMRAGVHEHLMFGEGEMDFAPIFAALREIRYAGPIHVELSRHSHNAVETAQKSFEYLCRF